MLPTIVKERARRMLRRTGWDLRRFGTGSDGEQRLVGLCGHRGLRVLFDVGAHMGQFADELIASGFQGRIISFEPQSSAHRELIAAAARRGGQWSVFERCALGAEPGTAEINLAGHSPSSSLLPMLARHLEVAPDSAYTTREPVLVRTLDEIVASGAVGEGPFALKLDVQGFESEVLRGARRILSKVGLIHTEMSLCALYEGTRLFPELFAEIVSYGYRCVGLEPEVIDAASMEMLQINGTFVRHSHDRII